MQSNVERSDMTVEQVYERLATGASLEGDDGAIRLVATFEPTAGQATKVFPPTFMGGGYVTENRWEGDQPVACVALDSTQSQANRCEEALQREVDAGRLWLPRLELSHMTHGEPFRVTSMTAPHRSRDAYFISSCAPDRRPFDATEVGAALLGATPIDVRSVYAHVPTDLVYGAWDSHRGKKRPVKFARAYSSELVGWHVQDGQRVASRMDPGNLGGDVYVSETGAGRGVPWTVAKPAAKAKKVAVSEEGLGNVAPHTAKRDGTAVPGGVNVRRIDRYATLSFAALARLGFGDASADQARAARACLAALALLGDRLAFAAPAVFLRSGCDLLTRSEELSWVGYGGASEPLAMGRSEARELLDLAVVRAAAVGMPWVVEPVRLVPNAELARLIDRSFLAGEPEEDE